jgi:hypothetical protein
MVYNTQDYWVFGLSPSSDILKNATFRKLDQLLLSGDRVGNTYSLGPVRKFVLQNRSLQAIIVYWYLWIWFVALVFCAYFLLPLLSYFQLFTCISTICCTFFCYLPLPNPDLRYIYIYIYIVTRRSDSWQGLGLEIGFIDHFNTRLVTTLNYSAIADFHTLQITSCSLFSLLCLY